MIPAPVYNHSHHTGLAFIPEEEVEYLEFDLANQMLLRLNADANAAALSINAIPYLASSRNHVSQINANQGE